MKIPSKFLYIGINLKFIISFFSKVLDRDTAEDVFQETFIKVIRTLKNGSYNEEGNFYPGLCVFHII